MEFTYKIYRALVNKTQQNVADELRIKVQQYSKYERLEQVPSVIMASRIAKALDVTTDEIARLYK